MLNSRKLFLLQNFRKNFVIRNFTSENSSKHKKKIEEKLNRQLTNEETEALEQGRAGFKKFIDFLLKREVYTWEDYRQQIIVNK
jgi:hypothetical protein